MRSISIFSLFVCFPLFAQDEAQSPIIKFAVYNQGKVAGRMDFGVVKRDEITFAVSAFYQGESSVKNPKAKAKPTIRAAGELEGMGFLGKYKRWETQGKEEHYWFAFIYDGNIKIRHEIQIKKKNIANVKEMGKMVQVVPLEPDQPGFALLLANAQTSDLSCISAKSMKVGKVSSQLQGEEEVATFGGVKRTLKKWVVSGDCGEYIIYLDEQGNPLVIISAGKTYQRMP